MVSDHSPLDGTTADAGDRVNVLRSLDEVIGTIRGDERSDGTVPTPAQRRTAAERLAAAADDEPIALSHRAGDVVAVLVTFVPWSTANGTGDDGRADTLSLGTRDRIVRALCETIESIATTVSWALVDHVDTLRTGLTDGPTPQRLWMAQTFVAIADDHPEAIEGEALPIEMLVTDGPVRLRQAGAELVASIARDQPTAATSTLPKLLDCLNEGDPTLREAATDAIHELSIARPAAVVDETAVVGQLLTDQSQPVREHAVRILIELCGTDSEAVWDQEDRIRAALESETARNRETVSLLLVRMTTESPAKMAERHDLLTAVLGDEVADVREAAPWILRELAVTVPAVIAPRLSEVIETTLEAVTDPERRATILLAGSAIVEAADDCPPALDLAGIYPLLNSEDPSEQAAAAAMLDAAHRASDLDVRAGRLADVDGVELPDDSGNDRVSETLDRIESRATEAGDSVQTEFDPSMTGIRPEYRLVEQEEFTTVIERVRRRLRADSPDTMSDLETLVGFLDTESNLVLELTLSTLSILANSNPAAVARHLDAIDPLVAHDEPAVRNRALMIANVCFQYRPRRVLADIEYFVDALDHETHVTSQLLSRILFLVRDEQIGVLVPHTETLLDAWSADHPIRTFIVEGVLSSIVSSRPDALRGHRKTLLAYSGRELAIDPDELEAVDAVDTLDATFDDETVQTIIPLDFLLDEESQISSRPSRSALRSLVLTSPDIVVENQETIRDLLTADVAKTRNYGLRLIELSAVGDDERIATFTEDLVDRIETESDPDVRAQAVSAFHEVAEADPVAVASYIEVVYPIVDDGRPEQSDDDIDAETEWALLSIAECIDELPPERYPTVEQIRPYLEHDTAGAAAVVEIFATLVNVDPETLRRHRSTVVEWCSGERAPTTQVNAIETLHRLGTRSTIDALVSEDD
jgi:hypothetical protein